MDPTGQSVPEVPVPEVSFREANPLPPPPPPFPPPPPPQSPPPLFPPPPVEGPVSVAVASSQEKKVKKIPFMVITIVLFLIIGGYGIAFLFMRYNSEMKVIPAPVITPPVTLEPTMIEPTAAYGNPFATPSGEFENPFATPSSFVEDENPFGAQPENPFSDLTESEETGNQPYENPFEGTE